MIVQTLWASPCRLPASCHTCAYEAQRWHNATQPLLGWRHYGSPAGETIPTMPEVVVAFGTSAERTVLCKLSGLRLLPRRPLLRARDERIRFCDCIERPLRNGVTVGFVACSTLGFVEHHTAFGETQSRTMQKRLR